MSERPKINKRLEGIHLQLREDLPALAAVVRRTVESQQTREEESHSDEFRRRCEESEAFHREVKARSWAFIKMMEERLRERRAGNSAS